MTPPEHDPSQVEFTVDGETFLARRRPGEPDTFELTWESGPPGRGLSVRQVEATEASERRPVEWAPSLDELERLARDLIDLADD